jgi:hypothetical protein
LQKPKAGSTAMWHEMVNTALDRQKITPANSAQFENTESGIFTFVRLKTRKMEIERKGMVRETPLVNGCMACVCVMEAGIQQT